MYLTRFLRKQPQTLAHLVDHYAQYPPTGLTMKKIVEFGNDERFRSLFFDWLWYL